jgi:hypothetical protein
MAMIIRIHYTLRNTGMICWTVNLGGQMSHNWRGEWRELHILHWGDYE